MTDRLRIHHAGAPPWLWLWFLLYFMQLPELASWPYRIEVPAKQKVRVDEAGSEAADSAYLKHLMEVRNGFRRHLSESRMVLSRMMSICVVVPLFAPAIIMIMHAFPRWHARKTEKKYWLVPASETANPGVEEISQFVATNSPSVEVYVNLARTGLPPFCYASGYRTSRIAVFGDLFMLWHKDREAAECVIMHELCHARQGDAMLLGPVGLLQQTFRILTGVMLMIPNIVMIVTLVYVMCIDSYYGEIIGLVMTVIAFLGMLVMGLLIATAIWLFMMGLLSFFLISLIAAVWSAEVNADYVAQATARSERGISSALGIRQRYRSVWQRYLAIPTHPPTFIRRWLAPRPRLALATLLIVFPLSLFAFPVILDSVTALGYLAFGDREPLTQLWSRLGVHFLNRSGRLLVVGLACIVWPLVWKRWARLWTTDANIDDTVPVPRIYWLAGGLWCCVAMIGVLVDAPAALRGLVMFGL